MIVAFYDSSKDRKPFISPLQPFYTQKTYCRISLDEKSFVSLRDRGSYSKDPVFYRTNTSTGLLQIINILLPSGLLQIIDILLPSFTTFHRLFSGRRSSVDVLELEHIQDERFTYIPSPYLLQAENLEDSLRSSIKKSCCS